jgi:propanol-preferring alcohol dehydrogenase
MKAMILEQPRKRMRLGEVDVPEVKANEVLVEIQTCGVCRTDLHVLDGELKKPKLPLILGHEIVGKIVETGTAVKGLYSGQRVGIPWLAYTCGKCSFCLRNQENLCDNALFTGYTTDGGYAEYTVANENYCFPLPDAYDSMEIAPLLCAGLIGWRSYRAAGEFQTLGMYGFGGAAHILTQVAKSEGKDVYAFTRPQDEEGQEFARSLGAAWAGGSNDSPPSLLDAAIIFAPIGNLVVSALKVLRKGGTIVCGGIHMSDIPPIPYDLLWQERSIRSVANLTRQDASEFLTKAREVRIKTTVKKYELEQANEALDDLRATRFSGAAVLSVKA